MRQFYFKMRHLLQIALFKLIAGVGEGQYQFFGKIATHLPYFHLLINTPLSNDQMKIFNIFHLHLFITKRLLAQLINQAHLLLKK